MKRLGCFFISLLLLWSDFLPVTASEFPEVESNYVYALNLDEDRVLYEKAAHEKMYPASLTKMMSVLVALEHIEDMDEVIVFNEEMLQGLKEESASVVGYQAGDQARIIDLLYGIILPSGADASRAIAFHIAGSEEAFVDLMNEKTEELQLENTHFMNSSGLHDDEHYSTAFDMAVILKEGLKNETFQRIFTSDSYVIGSGLEPNASTLAPIIAKQGTTIFSTKAMMLDKAGIEEDIITGSKTGFTLEGGLCMASISKHENAHYLLITGQAGTDVSTAQQIKDAYAIYSYLFSTYERKLLYAKDELLQEVDIRFGAKKRVGIKPVEDVYALVEKEHPQVETKLVPTEIRAPIDADESIATMQVLYQGEERFTFSVVADAKVTWSFPACLSYYLFERYLFLPLVFMVCLLLLWRKKRNEQVHIVETPSGFHPEH